MSEHRGRTRKRASLDETALTPREKRRKEDPSPAQLSTEQNTTSTALVTTSPTSSSTALVTTDGITGRPVRVYADGIYDLFHFGHARSLEQAKKLFPNTILIVGVCNDELTHRLKGRTVMTDKERAESLRHCKWVDEVVEDAPWIVTQDFIDKHQIDFVAHGEDIILDEHGVDIYKFVKDQGKYKTIKRTDGISTSDIILRIVKDYDSYVRRNLARGYTGKQMNISFVKEKQIQMENNIKKFKEKVQDRVNKVKKWPRSQRIVNFLKKFGGELEKMVGLEDSGEYDSDEFLGYLSPERIMSSPEPEDHLETITEEGDIEQGTEEREKEEQLPPHV